MPKAERRDHTRKEKRLIFLFILGTPSLDNSSVDLYLIRVFLWQRTVFSKSSSPKLSRGFSQCPGLVITPLLKCEWNIQRLWHPLSTSPKWKVYISLQYFTVFGWFSCKEDTPRTADPRHHPRLTQLFWSHGWGISETPEQNWAYKIHSTGTELRICCPYSNRNCGHPSGRSSVLGTLLLKGIGLRLN